MDLTRSCVGIEGRRVGRNASCMVKRMSVSHVLCTLVVIEGTFWGKGMLPAMDLCGSHDKMYIPGSCSTLSLRVKGHMSDNVYAEGKPGNKASRMSLPVIKLSVNGLCRDGMVPSLM
jgi:hypothetical protein